MINLPFDYDPYFVLACGTAVFSAGLLLASANAAAAAALTMMVGPSILPILSTILIVSLLVSLISLRVFYGPTIRYEPIPTDYYDHHYHGHVSHDTTHYHGHNGPT